MRDSDLTRRAAYGRLLAKLRADCLEYGAPLHLVDRLQVVELIDLRARLRRRLMEQPPRSERWDD